MEELPNELLSFIFDFVPEESLELRKVCDEWDYVITKYYNKDTIDLGTFKEIIEIFYRSKLNVDEKCFLDYIRYIYRFNLGFTNIKDVSGLSKIHTLILCGCWRVKDVSGLINVHTLDLRCTSVKDFSALRDAHILNLNLTKIKDASALGKVHTLILGMDVRDVSALGNVHTLDLSRTNIKDVSALDNVQFCLRDSDIDDSFYKSIYDKF